MKPSEIEIGKSGGVRDSSIVVCELLGGVVGRRGKVVD